MKRTGVAILGAFFMLASCTSTPSSTVPTEEPTGIFKGSFELRARLDPDQVVTSDGKAWKPPAELKDASGNFQGTLDAEGGTLTWDLGLSDIGNPSIKIVDVHIGPEGEYGAVLVRLCGPCEKDQPSGVVELDESTVGDFTTKPTWVTLVTGEYPDGLIRGQIKRSRN